jgi:hypothetical protein
LLLKKSGKVLILDGRNPEKRQDDGVAKGSDCPHHTAG